MKFLLLKTLLLRKGKDEGFTLPMVMAIGLVMVLLSAVNLVQSGEENLMAISQEGSSDALAMAELGVSRYRDLLINNRVLAVNDLGNWTNPNILNQVCTIGIDGTGGWADTSDNDGWRDINVGGTVIGSYKLEAYEYDRDPTATDDNNFDLVDDANNDTDGDGDSDAEGLLTVQGRDNIGSIAQLEVTIPLGVNTQDLQNLQPGLWIHQGSVSNTGTINLTDGNIVIYRNAAVSGTSDLCQNATIGGSSGYSAVRDSRDLPPIMDRGNFTSTYISSPSVLNFRELDGDISDETHSSYVSGNPVPNNYPSNYYNPDTKKIVLGTAYDETNNSLDNPIGSGSDRAFNSGITINGQNEDVFYYSTDAQDLVLDDGEAIIGDGNSRVIIYVDGDLDINTGTNGVRLVNSSHQSESPPTTPPGIARYLEIHVDGDVDISGDGTLDITGLLRVDGTVNITGSSTVNVTGSIWANNWDASNGATINIDADRTTITNTNVTPPQTITVGEYNFFSNTSERTPAPLTFRPSGWERQEAN